MYSLGSNLKNFKTFKFYFKNIFTNITYLIYSYLKCINYLFKKIKIIVDIFINLIYYNYNFDFEFLLKILKYKNIIKYKRYFNFNISYESLPNFNKTINILTLENKIILNHVKNKNKVPYLGFDFEILYSKKNKIKYFDNELFFIFFKNKYKNKLYFKYFNLNKKLFNKLHKKNLTLKKQNIEIYLKFINLKTKFNYKYNINYNFFYFKKNILIPSKINLKNIKINNCFLYNNKIIKKLNQIEKIFKISHLGKFKYLNKKNNEQHKNEIKKINLIEKFFFFNFFLKTKINPIFFSNFNIKSENGYNNYVNYFIKNFLYNILTTEKEKSFQVSNNFNEFYKIKNILDISK
jgi:hypothetical protein